MFRFENEIEMTISEEIQLYAEKQYTSDIIAIMLSKDVSSHVSIAVDSMSLFESNIAFAHYMFQNPRRALQLLDNSFQKVSLNISKNHASKADMIYRQNLHVRLIALPNLPEVYRSNLPSCSDVGQFLCISGTVVRASSAKMLQYKKQWRCGKCKYQFIVEAEIEQGYICEKPLVCCNPESCFGKNFTLMSSDINTEWCKDYQEIKLQEQVYNLNIGSVPKSMWVVLEDDLVESCHPGNDVIVSGVLIQQWKPLLKSSLIDIDLVILAHNIEVQNKMSSGVISKEMAKGFGQFWQDHKSDPLEGRNFILSSICPQVFGMYIVKLAVALVLAGGVQKQSGNSRIRGDSHLLLVGDPGTAKSQFLKYATKVSSRSVLTSGIGTTNAGLTVSAVKESGKWQLEAGALVLADGGICCIDEFSCIKEQDKTCIHEAMEQQTISVAKAGLVCSLNTRCSILAATNPKGKYDENMSISENTALGSPLLSRFDIILVLLDTYDETWDDLVSSYILEGRNVISSNKLWSVENMKNYITLIRHINPKLSVEAESILRSYYTKQRSFQAKHASRTTPRLLQSLIRLAEGHARLMFRTEVLVIDAVIAVVLVESSMLGNSILEGLRPLHTVFPNNPKAEYKEKAEKVFYSLNIGLSSDKNYECFYEESAINMLLSDISSVWGQKEDPFIFGSPPNDRSGNSDPSPRISSERSNLQDFTDSFKMDVLWKNTEEKDSIVTPSHVTQITVAEIHRSNEDSLTHCDQSETNQISTLSDLKNIFGCNMTDVTSFQNDFSRHTNTSKSTENLSPLDQILQEPEFHEEHMSEHSNLKNISTSNMFNNPAIHRTTSAVNEITVTDKEYLKSHETTKAEPERNTTDIFEQLGISPEKNIKINASSSRETTSSLADKFITEKNTFPSKRSIHSNFKKFSRTINMPNNPAIHGTTSAVNEISVTDEVFLKSQEKANTQPERSTTDIFEQLGILPEKNIETDTSSSAETSGSLVDKFISGKNTFPSKRSIADQLKTFAFSKSQSTSHNIFNNKNKTSNTESETKNSLTSDSEQAKKCFNFKNSQNQYGSKKFIFNMIKSQSKNSSDTTLEDNRLQQNLHESSKILIQDPSCSTTKNQNKLNVETETKKKTPLENQECEQSFILEEPTPQFFEKSEPSPTITKRKPVSDKLKMFVFSKAKNSTKKN